MKTPSKSLSQSLNCWCNIFFKHSSFFWQKHNSYYCT